MVCLRLRLGRMTNPLRAEHREPLLDNHITLQSGLLIYPFFFAQVSYESLLPLARCVRLRVAACRLAAMASDLEEIFHVSLLVNN